MQAYYASRISEHISETPEGYLICRDVPIARTGKQDYLRSELGFEDNSSEMVAVMRRPEDVFSPATIASFEGKPVTSDHPYEGVTSQNASQYMMGATSEVRQGTGEDADKLLATLIIYDEYLINEIKSGKREVSCGYDSAVEDIDGTLYQTAIRGNHVAVVDAGRAGEEVRIKDTKPEKRQIIRRNDRMKLGDRLINLFKTTKDASPEELATVVADMVETEQQTADDDPSTAATTDNDPLMEAVKILTDKVSEMNDNLASMVSPSNDNDPLEAVVAELAQEVVDEEGDPAQEDDSLENPENIDEETPEVTDVDPTEDEETPAASTEDKKAVLNHIRAMKPVVAKVKDAAQSKAMVEALVKLGRSVKRTPATKNENGYKRLADAKAKALQKQAALSPGADAAERQSNYDNMNPHKKKGA